MIGDTGFQNYSDPWQPCCGQEEVYPGAWINSFIDPLQGKILLTPDNYIDIYFSFNDSPDQNNDILTFRVSDINIHTQGLISASLYDGDDYIGTYNDTTQGYNRHFFFIQSDSLFTLLSPTIIDFSSIKNGSINGLLRLSTTEGEFDIDFSNSGITVGFGTSSSGLGAIGIYEQPEIKNIVSTPKEYVNSTSQ